MLHPVFEAEDLQVSDAKDGAEGVRKAQELKPNLIILALSMPAMNGLEAVRALKLLMPHVPLLMFTYNVGAAMERGSLCRFPCCDFRVRLRLVAAVGRPRAVTAWIGRGGSTAFRGRLTRLQEGRRRFCDAA
jgi:CheY-like chemotaxis protein